MPSARTALTAACIGASLAGLAGTIIISDLSAAAAAGLAFAGWLGVSIIGDLLHRIKPFRHGGRLQRLKRIGGPVWGMWVAHFGMVIFLIGALGEGLFQTEVITRAKPGETIMLAEQEAKFIGVEVRQGPNYQTETAVVDLFENGTQITTLYPEKRFYPAARQTTTEAAIRTRLSGDHYMVLGDGDAKKGYTLRLYYKPLVSFIWLGTIFMALGGSIAILRRPRPPAKTTAEAA
jgi:cytochrome c-type biogenesis protein CcmF